MEIGSEFSIDCLLGDDCQEEYVLPSLFDFLGKSMYLLSGRTAIDCICKDILSFQKVSRVYMPAYGCASMQQPFIDNGIQIDLYDVEYTGTGLSFAFDTTHSIEILYLNNYFGFHQPLNQEWIKELRKQGTIVVYDKTHSLFQENDPWLEVADYAFCSLRKWFAITSGAVMSKRKGEWTLPPLMECPYVQSKQRAQLTKHRYLAGDPTVSKADFYPSFGLFDAHLKQDYKNYKMDRISMKLLAGMDLEEVRTVRQNNARFYYNELQGVKGIRFLFGDLPDEVVPLFVPVLLESEAKRVSLKAQLVQHQLYCPSHWPKNDQIDKDLQVNMIYDTELSLICDQRYNSEQLKAITKILTTN